MTERISLIEAYDNRDIIAQLVRLRDDVDELLNILKDVDPDGDLTNVVTKTGDQTIDGVKTFIGKIVADCDIIQNGAAYETHAEQVFSTKDYIVLRDGALGGLSPGDYSGLRVNKYDSVNDGHLVIDRDGTARVGDVDDEQPLATRDEASNMTSGALVKWDGVNKKMIAPASNVGDDTHPLKIVGGKPEAVSDELQKKITVTVKSGSESVTATGEYDFTSEGVSVTPGKYLVVGFVQIPTGSASIGTVAFGHKYGSTRIQNVSNFSIPGSNFCSMTFTDIATIATDTVIYPFLYVSSAGLNGNVSVNFKVMKLE